MNLFDYKERYFKKYQKKVFDLDKKLDIFKKKSAKLDFEFLKISSSLYSANIEWNSLDLNSFMNLDLNKKTSKDKKEIDDLILAYEFAKSNELNEKNFLKSHKISTKTILNLSNRWNYRQEKVWVLWKEWLVYLAIEAEKVEKTMKDLFFDIKFLLEKKLTAEEIFFFASIIHLRFVHIHPFFDGNWRVARILEKWFLSEKLWDYIWALETEKYYLKNRWKYYQNINLWINYYELDYDKSLNFLLMLPKLLD